MSKTNFEKDEADRAAIKDHLDFLDGELIRHAAMPLLIQEADDYLIEAAENKKQLIDNQRNMRHHAPKTIDMGPYILGYNSLLAQATRLHAAFHGIRMSFPVTARPPPAAAASTGATQSIKLPPLELPRFSGNLQEWVSFRDLYTTAIHNSSLSKVEKLTQLKALLTGEAARQIRSIVLSEANYDVAWKALNERYENNRELLISILKRLTTQPSITTSSATSLRTLIDTTKECVRSLEILTIPTQHWDAMIFFILFTKLDNMSRELWESTLPDTSIPDLNKMYEFLEQRARALAASSAPPPRQQQMKQPQGHVRAHHAETSRCPLGCSKKHFLIYCPEFQKLNPHQRSGKAKKLNRCLNCLAEGHQTSNCRSQHTCKTCKRKHHSMLHFAQEGGTQQQESTQGQIQNHHLYSNNSIRTGILATSLVQVHAPSGGNMRRALLLYCFTTGPQTPSLPKKQQRQ